MVNWRVIGLALATGALGVLPISVCAQATSAPRPIPNQRLVANNLTLFRWNPIGLENQLRLGFAQKLYDHDHKALRDNFAWFGTYVRLNPASARAAAMVEVQPASVINLRFSAEYLYFFGNFTFIQSRADPSGDWSDTTMKANKQGALGNYAGGGLHYTFEPLLQAKVGPIAVRNRTLFGWFDLDLQRGDRVFYEATVDTAVPARGLVIANDFDVIYQRPMDEALLSLGVRVSSVAPQYAADLAATGAKVDNSHHRVGLLAAYTLYDDGYTRFNKPTVLLITSWYLQHRFRTGQDVSRAVPYFVLGFAWQSDLL
ncbi:MAG: hypothetical protein FJ100_13920 [Deltaproteobacteria bacterium]|nr:hypothetical protein [Deltaproteobacteria bacterium]